MSAWHRMALCGAGSALFLVCSGFGATAKLQSSEFPQSFLWGAATAAHQIEGGNSGNDWWEWEHQCHLADCEKSGDAADGYRRYREDLALAQGLGLGAYRMSVEWARLEPTRGVFSDAEFEHYREVLKEVRARGMKVVLTLQHFTLPLWVAHHAPQGQNSWLDPKIPDFFAAYTERVVDELGDLVDYWITVNEPTVNMLTGYVVGVHPPGIQDLQKAPIALANFLKAHARAYHVIHKRYPKARVSFAHHVRVFDPHRSWNPIDQTIAGFLHTFWNHQFIRSIRDGKIHFQIPTVIDYKEDYPGLKGTLDYLGINYYSRDLIAFDSSSPQKFAIRPNRKAPKNDLGWEIYPLGMYRVLKDLGRYGYPILIAENGIADSRDDRRARFICDHLREVRRAMDDGVNVFGYLHWSLVDNFEWSEGHKPRFGLAEVDYATMKRTLRPSARVYSEIIRRGSLKACKDLESLFE